MSKRQIIFIITVGCLLVDAAFWFFPKVTFAFASICNLAIGLSYYVAWEENQRAKTSGNKQTEDETRSQIQYVTPIPYSHTKEALDLWPLNNRQIH